MAQSIYESLRLRSVKFGIMIIMGLFILITPDIYYAFSASKMTCVKSIIISISGLAVFVLGIIGYFLHMWNRVLWEKDKLLARRKKKQ